MNSSRKTCPMTLTVWQRSPAVVSHQRRRRIWSGRWVVPWQQVFLALLVLLLSALPRAAAVQAAMITVNVLTDNAGDSCPTTCSLRAALATANAGDEIRFSVTGTILLSQGELVVDKNVTITGPGETSLAIDGNQASRVMEVNGGVTATLSGLTIQNGAVGGVDNSGGIRNQGDLTLTNCTISGNAAGIAGGISNAPTGTLTLTNCTISGNSGRIDVGGISNSGTMTLTNCTLSGNSTSGGYGGGILNEGTLTLTNCTLSGNAALVAGGGIVNLGGTLTLINCTLSGNSSDHGGGGISGGGTMTLTNCTLSGNSTSGGYGGGIENGGTGTLTLTNSTLSGNSASQGGGGIANFSYGTLTLASSIVANSLGGGNCAGGTITSHGDNLSSDATCVTTNPALNDRNATDPLLDPAGLQENGGPTLTIALQPTSPALDAVLHNTCPPPATDQRGFLRPANGDHVTGARCDIGAFEFAALPPVVNSLVTFVPLPSTYQTTANTTGCPGGFVGKFSFMARLTDKSASPPLSDLGVEVDTLSNGNLLQNADNGPGGVGATVTVPQGGKYADGELSPREFVDVPFVICLKTKSGFTFFVDVLGIEQ